MKEYNKSALITGVTGQDGSFLAELLLDKNYKIYGLIRRGSTSTTERINHLLGNPNFKLIEGDLQDQSSLIRAIEKANPDEVYHLGANSFVGTSWQQPLQFGEITGLGTARILEAIRVTKPDTKIYNAATSELFGINPSPPNTEQTPFYPRSPYGVAKLYSYWMVRNYRESYGMFACSGLLHNHECFFYETPIITRNINQEVDIVYIGSLVNNRANHNKDTATSTHVYETPTLEVWDGQSFVKLKAVSRRKLYSLAPRLRKRLTINTRNGSVQTTPHHKMILSNGNKIQASECINDTKLMHGAFPQELPNKNVTLEFAEWLGLMAGDGYISKDGTQIRFSNINSNLRDHLCSLMSKIYCNLSFTHIQGISGFNGRSEYVEIQGLSKVICLTLRYMLYDKHMGHKKVPSLILNSPPDAKMAFLNGYNAADGLKLDSDTCTYDYKSFGSNSPLLTQGILYLIAHTTKQKYNINVFIHNNKIFNKTNLLSPVDRGGSGKNFLRPRNIVKKQLYMDELNQHIFDIETESGEIMAGTGTLVVANSPRRGEEFVTKKITMAVAKIKHKKQDCLYLGNMLAKRDWGHANDYVRAMYLMLQQDIPQDYIIASGETHSVQEFCTLAFHYAGIELGWEGQDQDLKAYDIENNQLVIAVDPKFYRPAEVDLLLGDPTKARKELEWYPEYSFRQLVQEMVEYDLSIINK